MKTAKELVEYLNKAAQEGKVVRFSVNNIEVNNPTYDTSVLNEINFKQELEEVPADHLKGIFSETDENAKYYKLAYIGKDILRLEYIFEIK